ncbi:MAG TPA: hypothetical protein VK851_12990, partial [Anaerolineales bacterium]|nr:hypothetical protein [Anaerolineales bacterium]
LFKDFFLLAEHETPKHKYLYVIGTKHPIKFLTGGRSLESVMSRNNKLWSEFQVKYGSRFKKVSEYFEVQKSVVQLVDITEIVPQFRNTQIRENNE